MLAGLGFESRSALQVPILALMTLFAMTATQSVFAQPRQITTAAHGHILANRNCWSPDGQWLHYDVRHDETIFDGNRIERVHVDTGNVEVVYTAPSTAFCGVPTVNPTNGEIVLLRSPEKPTEDWQYAAWHRFGMIGSESSFKVLDARDVVKPFTPGALRGGTHLHMFSGDGRYVSSTYEDAVLATSDNVDADPNNRVIAVTELGKSVEVPSRNPRNHNGNWTVVVTRVVNEAAPGSDEITRAYSDAWIAGADSIAFFGLVAGNNGESYPELFRVDLSSNLHSTVGSRVEGTPTSRPGVPVGVQQHRLTRTENTKFPGLSGPRHWPVSAPDGKSIGIYRKGDDGRIRFAIVPADGGPIRDVTDGSLEPTSSFTWNNDGSLVTFVADGSVVVVSADAGTITRLTEKSDPGPRHHACVFSLDGNRISYMQPVEYNGQTFDQIFVVNIPETTR